MPLYRFKCDRCNSFFEKRVSYDLSMNVKCSACHGYVYKVPVPVRVNWNGRKPSDGGVTDYVKQMVHDAPYEHGEIQAKKERGDG